MNSNIHAFAQPYWSPMYRAAERLSDAKLDERINMYEDAQRKQEQMSPVKRFFHEMFIGLPLILDNVSPLVDVRDAYSAARQVRDFRQKEKSLTAKTE